MEKRTIWVLLLLVISLNFINSIRVQAQPPLKIGVLYPLSGPMALLGTEEWRGAEVARVKQNEKGGLFGREIVYVKADAPDAAAATAEAERLITVEGVKVIVGSYSSSLAYASTAVCEKYKVIAWEMGGIADAITQRGFHYTFRINPLASDFGIRAAEIIIDPICPRLGLEPRKTKVAIMFEDTLYGTTVGSWAAKTCLEKGLQVVAVDAYSARTTDLSSLVLKFKALKPDVLIATSYLADGILFWRQSKELDFNVKAFIGTGACHGIKDFALACGDDVNYILNIDITQPRNVNDKFAPGVKEYSARYEKLFGHPPRSGHSLRAYVGCEVLWDVIKKAGLKEGQLDPEAIRKAAHETDIPEGGTASGWGVKFAPPGHPHEGHDLRVRPVVMQWFDQEQYTVWPPEAAVRKIVLPLPTWEERSKGKK